MVANFLCTLLLKPYLRKSFAHSRKVKENDIKQILVALQLVYLLNIMKNKILTIQYFDISLQKPNP